MAHKKIQGEIDRVIKQTIDQISEFDRNVEHISPNQREKYELELKKFIKKLQRRREELKQYSNSNDVKNKNPINEAREIVDDAIERYKRLERACRTNTLDDSDEGIHNVEEIVEWIDAVISRMNEEIEQFEEEIRSLENKASNQDVEEDLLKIAELDESIHGHGFHVEHLSVLKKIFEKSQVQYLFQITTSQVRELQNHIDMYLDDNNFDEDIYSVLDIESLIHEVQEEPEYISDTSFDGISSDITDTISVQEPIATPEIKIEPITKVSKPSTITPEPYDLTEQNDMLMSSMRYLPEQVEAEKPKKYKPKYPYPHTPHFFPQEPSRYFEDPSLYEKFRSETLFFIFYYQQGTYQQYLAAKELKRQAWRYHKSYLTWFQRHDPPEEITADYERGTYVYFDYENGWCKRKKSNFTFEYKYLEDNHSI
eukprot:TRINITY_DN401_c0_g3_i1.p1 TRINITY_DN401_c0_g3~~TRINITY_DN401_c0_g3_i1.p1  ORF type:complete len:425 (-),score=112.75 TRINITY_DN401_c0_g3_i1:1-1275(-)